MTYRNLYMIRETPNIFFSEASNINILRYNLKDRRRCADIGFAQKVTINDREIDIYMTII